MMVITPKHVGTVSMSILILLLKNLCISWCKDFDNIKMHGAAVKKIRGFVFLQKFL
jgi:hypothetical protein